MKYLLSYLFMFWALVSNAKESPTELLAQRYVRDGVATLKARISARQDQQILNTVWSQSTSVLDDVFEADLLREMRKSGFQPSSIEFNSKDPFRIHIRHEGVKAVLNIRNLFLGHFEWNGVPIVLADHRSAVSLYGRLLEITKGRKSMTATIHDWLVGDAEAAPANPVVFASAGYFIITGISAALNTEDCERRFSQAEQQVQKQMRQCQNELAQVTINPAAYNKSNARALDKNIKDVMAGYKFSEIREPSCAYLIGGAKFRAGWPHFEAKHSCVVGFESYCARLDEFVACHAQIRSAAGVSPGSVVQSRSEQKQSGGTVLSDPQAQSKSAQ